MKQGDIFIPVGYSVTTLNRRHHPQSTLVRGLTFIREVIKDWGIRRAFLQGLLPTTALGVRDQRPNYLSVVTALVIGLCFQHNWLEL